VESEQRVPDHYGVAAHRPNRRKEGRKKGKEKRKKRSGGTLYFVRWEGRKIKMELTLY
jgi:hypothetical protein